MPVQFNTVSLTPQSIGYSNKQKFVNVIPVKNEMDSISFTGTKKVSPVKAFLGTLALTLGLGAPSGVMTGCDVTGGLDTAKTVVVTPPLSIDSDASLTPLEKRFKRYMGKVEAADTTKAGPLDSVRSTGGLSGQDVAYKIDTKLSSPDTIVYWYDIYDGHTADHAQLYGKKKFFVDSSDGLNTINEYRSVKYIAHDPQQKLSNIRKFTVEANPAEIIDGVRAYDYLPKDSVSVYQRQISSGFKTIVSRIFTSVRK